MDSSTVVPVEMPPAESFPGSLIFGAVAIFAGRANAPVAIVATGNLADALGAARRSWPRDDLPTLVVARWAPCAPPSRS